MSRNVLILVNDNDRSTKMVEWAKTGGAFDGTITALHVRLPGESHAAAQRVHAAMKKLDVEAVEIDVSGAFTRNDPKADVPAKTLILLAIAANVAASRPDTFDVAIGLRNNEEFRANMQATMNVSLYGKNGDLHLHAPMLDSEPASQPSPEPLANDAGDVPPAEGGSETPETLQAGKSTLADELAEGIKDHENGNVETVEDVPAKKPKMHKGK